MLDGEAQARPRVEITRLGQPVVGNPLHPLPGRGVLLAATAKRLPPEADDDVAEAAERMAVGRHGVVIVPASDDLPQPAPLLGYRLVPASPEFLLERTQLGRHAVTPRLPLEQEAAASGTAANMREPQEVERLRLAQPAPLAIGRGEATKLQQAGLLRVQRQRVLLHALP